MTAEPGYFLPETSSKHKTDAKTSHNSIEASKPLWDSFRKILSDECGLKVDLIHDQVLSTALKNLSKNLGQDPVFWLRSLETDPQLRTSFCEHFTVGETWFFRDWTPYACLKQFADLFQARSTGRPLRILSIPSSTGDEPWSMAMLFAWKGWTPNQVSIDAVDLNRTSLITLEKGMYRSYSRRETNPEANLILDRFTQPIPDGFEIDPTLKSYVRAHQGNILDPKLNPGGLGFHYDVIFSRNLFIYLDTQARPIALAHLDRLLDPEGILYLGHTEGGVIDPNSFVTWNPEFSFAFTPRKASAPPIPEPVPSYQPGPIRPYVPLPAPPTEALRPPVAKPLKKPVLPKEVPLPAQNPIDEAREAANAGKLDLASRLYGDLLKAQPLSVELWRMAAIVEQAAGKHEDALRMFDRVLYLDPKDTQSLRMASLIRRQRGEIAKALQLERRLAVLDQGPIGEERK